MPTTYPTQSSQKVANIWSSSHGLVDEGSYFIATNPTPGTVIATTTSIRDATNAGSNSAQLYPVMLVYNPLPTSSLDVAKTIYPQYLWMMISQVPTTATTCDMAIWLEPNGASAYTTGGSTITPVALNPGVLTASRAKIYFGAITAAATTSGGVLVSRRRIVSAIPVTLDEWVFTFGDIVDSTNFLSNPATLKRVTIPLPPIAIPPGFAMKFGVFAAASTAAMSWEFEMGYVERAPGL